VIGRSGGIAAEHGNRVDPWAHFVNVFMLDRDGNRINRRNPQDIFVPLYNHQIPPGAGQTVHYRLQLPDELDAPVTVRIQLKYRKFDSEFMDFVDRTAERLGTPLRGHQPDQPYRNELPIVILAEDSVTFPVAGIETDSPQATSDIPQWQRWNDYGIGMLLKGKAELRQAADAFTEVAKLNRYDGPLNLARVLEREGRLDEAVGALHRARQFSGEPDFPRWTWAWLSGVVNRQQGRLDDAQQDFVSILSDNTAEMQERGFDFSKDYEVINQLGMTLFDQGKAQQRQDHEEQAQKFLLAAVEQFERTLVIDAENVTAHFNLQQLYALLGDKEKAAQHSESHARYKTDDTARGRAVRLARERYPAADFAAEDLVIYPLQRPDAPGLDP
jgi:tetratricopeptide (TPR) repeat protein